MGQTLEDQVDVASTIEDTLGYVDLSHEVFYEDVAFACLQTLEDSVFFQLFGVPLAFDLLAPVPVADYVVYDQVLQLKLFLPV